MWAMPPLLPHMPPSQPHMPPPQPHTMRRRFPHNHLPMSMEEPMSTADTLPRLRLRMNMELSRESTELSFLTVVSRLSPTTLTMTMASLLM